jgi:hypothetical protein
MFRPPNQKLFSEQLPEIEQPLNANTSNNSYPIQYNDNWCFYSNPNYYSYNYSYLDRTYMNSSLFAAVWAKNMSTLRGDGFG